MAARIRRPESRKQNNQRVQIRRDAADFIKMTAVVAIVVIVIILCIRLFRRVPSPTTFCEGVFVNDIPLGGLTYEEGTEKVNGLIDQRINKDTYTLTYGDKQWTFTPSEFDAKLDLTAELNLAWNFGHTGSKKEMRIQAASVKENPINYEREISYNEKKLSAFINQLKAEIDIAPVSAEVTVLPDGLQISRSANGQEISAEDLKQTLIDSLLTGTTDVIPIVPREVEAEYTTEELQANTQLIAEWRTSLAGSSSQRNKNVRRALQSFNGLAVQPEELVSFNTLVGKRTIANGFFEAPEYDGTTVVQGVGGGTCQASTTLYGAVLLADLDVVVRGSHSMTVHYTKPSLDAAVFDTKDFCFVNDLEYPVYFYTSVTDKWATVQVYGPPCEYEIKLESRVIDTFAPQGRKFADDLSGEHVYYKTDFPVLKTEGKDGMRSQAYRVYYDRTTGEEVRREDMDIDTYYASQPVYWRGVH